MDVDLRYRLATADELAALGRPPCAVLSWDMRLFMQHYACASPPPATLRACALLCAPHCLRCSRSVDDPHAPVPAGSLAQVVQARAVPTPQPGVCLRLLAREPAWQEPLSALIIPQGRAILLGGLWGLSLGLVHLESRHLLHCDVKPENALCHMRTPEEQGERDDFLDVKIADHGLAGDAVVLANGSLKRPGVRGIGTPGMMAPELFNLHGSGLRSATNASDVFSLGSTALEVLGLSSAQRRAEECYSGCGAARPKPWLQLPGRLVNFARAQR